MSSNIISDPGFIPVILQEQMRLDDDKFDLLPEDLKKFLYDFFRKKEKDNTDPGFKYVGLLEYTAGKQNYMLYFLPKYYDMAQVKSAKEILDKTAPVYKHFSLVLKTINKYRLEKSHSAIKENRLQTQLEQETETADRNSKLAVAVTLIEDYLANGVYTNMKDHRSLCGNGEIDWQHTINTINPVIRDEAPYYFDYWTADRIVNTETLITRLHEAIIKDCSISLAQWGLDELLELETPMPYEGELSDFGDKDGIVAIINQELSVQFITQKQNLLKLMRTYIELENTSITEGVSMFGTGSFHAVWEKVCGTVFGNQLDEPIDQSLLPKELKEKHIEKWSDIEARAKWRIDGGAEIDEEAPDEKDASKLRPDFVALDEKKSILYILDAKYYVPTFSDSVNGCPGVGDVNKQHLYQLTYHPLIKENNWQVVNAFLMPKSCKNFQDTEKAVKSYCSIFKDIRITHSNENDGVETNSNDGVEFSFAEIQTLFLEPEKLFGYYLDGNSKLLENEMLTLEPQVVIRQNCKKFCRAVFARWKTIPDLLRKHRRSENILRCYRKDF